MRFARGPRAVALAWAVLLGVYAGQALVAARRDSVTIDEFAHLPVGLYALVTHDFGLDPINPPLARMVFALPVLARGAELPPGRALHHWVFAGRFMRANAARYQSLYVSARDVVVAVALLLGVLVAFWARALYGAGADLAALFLFAFSPSLLAHGHLATLDLAGTLGITASLFLFWRLLAAPTLLRAAAVGTMVGLAVLCKLSSLLVGPALLLCLLAQLAGEGRRAASPGRWTACVGMLALAALAVMNLGYACSGTLRPLADAAFLPGGALAALQRAAPNLRLPLPLPLVEGIDQVVQVAVTRREYFYLLGELSTSTWWYYHLVAYLVKTPLALLILAGVALGRWLAGRSTGAREHCLWLPVGLVFAASALFNSQNIGVRHVLAVEPLLIVAAAPLLRDALAGLPAQLRALELRPASVAAALGTLWILAGTALVAPRYLQYFNELAGGPAGGHRVLIDSNLDWGQDLIRLREWMQRKGIARVALAYFGRVDPSVYGIAFDPLEREDSHGIAVVSASFLMGRPYFWYVHGEPAWVPPQTYAWLRDLSPTERVGSLFVYELP